MFVLFAGYLLLIPVRLTVGVPGVVDGLLGLFLFPAAVYALFYLPLRWSVISTLPVDRKIPGLIGGVGLIVLSLVNVAAVVAVVR